MKKILLSLLFISFVFSIFAKSVSPEMAKEFAKNFLFERVQTFKTYSYSEIEPNLIYTHKSIIEDKEESIYYIFEINSTDEGYIILSADDCAYPVLAYSFETRYSFVEMPDAYIDFMDHFVRQIKEIIKNNYLADYNIEREWHTYASKKINRNHLRAVAPLCSSKWDQNKYYNNACPSDSKGPDGHVYAGCVATAMGQVMYYHKYPTSGSGSKSYYHSTYGTQSANFGMATYNWSSMANSISTYNSAIANLLYHCGVSVEMNYSPNGSGAYTSDAATALKTYFGYKSTTRIAYMSSYTSSGWDAVLKKEFDSSRPVVYRGQGSQGGHAWVCDGYQGSSNNHFHMNWGWSGAKNGYYYTSNLNPGISFTSSQGAIIGIEPNKPVANYDLELYDDITTSPSPLVKNGAITVSLDVANFGSGSFSGDYAVALFDNNGDYVMDIEELTGYTLGANKHYTNGLKFTTNSLTVTAGTYMVAAFYRPTGGNWKLLEEGSYKNPITVTVTAGSAPTSLALYDSIQPTPNPIIEGKSVEVYVNFANYDQNNAWSGDFACVLHKLTGEVLEVIDTFNNRSLTAYSYYTNGITFKNTGLAAKAGEYLISIQHKTTGGSWEITDEDIYTNPVKVTIAPPPLQPDKYENNNTENGAYKLKVNFSNDKANVLTTGSNIHIDTDIDYYKIDLPTGYKYTIKSRVHDTRNSGDGNTYNGDVIYSYKTDNWSTTFNDIEASDINLSDGKVVYFKVEPYFYAKGNYLLELNITRSAEKADVYVYNENVTPLEVDAGKTITASCNIKNQGKADAPSSTVKFYISDDKSYNTWDIELGASNVGSLTVGGETTINKAMLIPANTSTGNWYIIFKSDADNNISESDESNNNAYQQIKVTKPNSIKEYEKGSFTIFPNPASENCLLKFNQTINTGAQIIINDASGKTIESILLKNSMNDFNLDVSEYSKGIYFIKVNGLDHQLSQKLIVE